MAVCKEAVLSIQPPGSRQSLAYMCHINYHDASKMISITVVIKQYFYL